MKTVCCWGTRGSFVVNRKKRCAFSTATNHSLTHSRRKGSATIYNHSRLTVHYGDLRRIQTFFKPEHILDSPAPDVASEQTPLDPSALRRAVTRKGGEACEMVPIHLADFQPFSQPHQLFRPRLVQDPGLLPLPSPDLRRCTP